MWISDDPIRNLINKKAMEKGESWASLSKKLDRNPAYIQQYMQRGIPKLLPEIVRYPLAKLLGIPVSRLQGFFPMEQDLEQTELQQQRKEGDGFDATITRQIPVYSQSTGGPYGEIKLAGKADDIPAPPILANVRGAYAIYMVDDRMEPRYFAGEIVYVHPDLPARNGDFVVLQILDTNAGKGSDNSVPLALVRRQINKNTFAQINPYEEMTVDIDKIINRHRIILAGGI